MKDDTYYAKNAEARRAYQREYYKQNRPKILRKLELDKHLNPDKRAELAAYQREYYLKNREHILAQRREKYRRKKAAVAKPDAPSDGHGA